MYATETIRGLGPDQLIELALAHERQAAVLRAAAAVRAEEIGMHRATQARFDKLDGAPALVAKFESQGMDRSTAITCTALQLDAPCATVAARVATREKQARAARQGEVIRLAVDGHSNSEIARRVGVHPDTVTRIVKRKLRQVPQAAE